ncbi:MAG: hypothetical protein ABJN62_09260 [Halioglobus sp.]
MTTIATQAGAPNVTPAPLTRTNLQWLVWVLLFLAIFSGFQGGRYYMANRLQEVGIASGILLYLIGTWRAFFVLPTAEWRTWSLGPLLLIGSIMGISSVVFSIQYEGKLLYSFFSAREFLLALIGPAIYLLCRTGLPLAGVEKVFWFALAMLMLNYLFFYFTLDLRDAFFSSDHTVSNLVTFDEWRGFRLKPPLFAIMVALLAGLMQLTQSRSALQVVAVFALVALGAYIWSIVLFRSTLATMALSVCLYPVFLSRLRGAHLAVVITPVIMLAAPVALLLALDHFLQADGGNIRAKAFALAFEHIPTHLLLGAGEDSAYGQSYQDIVARYFYPSDLGLVGTLYKYGVIGVCLYLVMHFKIWVNLWRANLAVRSRTGRHNALVWALLMFMTAQTFNLLLNPGLAYAQGITLGTVALALARLHLAQWSPKAQID